MPNEIECDNILK